MGRPTAAPFVFAALNRVNIVEDTAILVFHVRVIVFHVRRHSRFMIPRRSYHARLRARGVRGALPPGRGVWGGLRPPQGSRGVWGAARPPMVDQRIKLILSQVVERLHKSRLRPSPPSPLMVLKVILSIIGIVLPANGRNLPTPPPHPPLSQWLNY